MIHSFGKKEKFPILYNTRLVQNVFKKKKKLFTLKMRQGSLFDRQQMQRNDDVNVLYFDIILYHLQT